MNQSQDNEQQPQQQNTQSNGPQQQPEKEQNNTQDISKDIYGKTDTRLSKGSFAFSALKKLLFVIGALGIITYAGLLLYTTVTQNNANPTPQEETPREEPIEKPEEDPVPIGVGEDGFIEFIDDQNKLSIKYFPEATFEEPVETDNITTYKVIFSGENQQVPIIDPDDVIDGYLFRIVINKNIYFADVGRAALELRSSYFARCAEDAQISSISPISVSGFEGQTFSVIDCQRNYIETFIVRESTVYQFTRVYRGDIGIEQRYKNQVAETFGNVGFLNTVEITPTDVWTSFVKNLQNGQLTIKYPTELDKNCCNIAGPLNSNLSVNIPLVLKESRQGNNNSSFTGVGVFVDNNQEGLGFDDYIVSQRTALEENYRLVLAREPGSQSETLEYNGYKAIKLTDTAWWGTFVIFDLPDENNKLVFVLAEPELAETYDFDDVFENILNTVNYTPYEQDQ